MAKKISKIKSVNIQKQKYLTQYLIRKAYTLKDLKCEIILMVCDMLIENYLIDEDNSDVLMSGITQAERSIVNETMRNLQIDIHQNILTINKIQEIINSQKKRYK